MRNTETFLDGKDDKKDYQKIHINLRTSDTKQTNNYIEGGSISVIYP